MAIPRRREAGAAWRTNCGMGLLVQGKKEMAITKAQVPSCLRARTAHGATTPVVFTTPIGTYGPLHAHDAAAGTAWIASSNGSVSARASEVVTEAWEWLAPCTSDASDASEPRRCRCGMGAWNMFRTSPIPRRSSSGISGVCGRSPNRGFGTTRTVMSDAVDVRCPASTSGAAYSSVKPCDTRLKPQSAK